MSPKKAASAKAKKPAATSKRKASADGKGAQAANSTKAATKKSVAANAKSIATAAVDARTMQERSLSNDDIGAVAGEVWRVLSERDRLTLAALEAAVGAPADILLAAVGWLAREDKLAFDASGGTLKITLRR